MKNQNKPGITQNEIVLIKRLITVQRTTLTARRASAKKFDDQHLARLTITNIDRELERIDALWAKMDELAGA